MGRPRLSDDTVAFSFKMPRDLRKAFKKTAQARDRSMSQELRSMVRAYIRRHSDKRQHEMDELLEEADV